MSLLSCPWVQQLYCIWILHPPGRTRASVVLRTTIKWTQCVSYYRLGFNFAVSPQRMVAGTSFWKEIMSYIKALSLYWLVEEMEIIEYDGNLVRFEPRTSRITLRRYRFKNEIGSRTLRVMARLRIVFGEWTLIRVKPQTLCSKMCHGFCHQSELHAWMPSASPYRVCSSTRACTHSVYVSLSSSCQATVSFMSRVRACLSRVAN